MNIRISAVAAMLLLAPSTNASEMPVAVAPEVIVTATRLPQYRTQALQPATVITARDIRQAGQETLPEVLQSLGGAEISSNGGFGQPASVFLRGANSGHTLVLVDGMRLSSATTGTTALENIPVNQIERIEVVPGPLSGVYGSDAIGGVIQIFTKSAQAAPGMSFEAGAGSYNTRTVNGRISSVVNDTEFGLAFGHLVSDGFDATKPSLPFSQHNPDRDGYRNSNFSGMIAHHFGDDHEVGVMFFRSEGSTHFDAGPATDDVNHQSLTSFSLYSRNRLTRNWQSTLRIGESEDNQNIVGAFPGSFRTREPQLTWQNDVKLGPGTAVAGVEYLEQNVASDTLYTQRHRSIRSAFGGYSGAYGHHLWQVNVRDDDNSQFGNRQTGSVGYGYRITPAVKLRANAGTAFRAPTFNDLYYPSQPPFFFSNPNLRPERSRSREVGIDVNLAGQRLTLTHFENDITDLITIVTDPVTFVSTTQNVNEARIRGNELGYEGSWRGYRASAHMTFQEPVNAATGRLLPRRAREYGTVAVNKHFGPWRLGSELIASGARFDSNSEDPATRMHGYALLNLVASYAINREWLVRARWNNVTNRDYELARHFNTPGSNVFVALQYRPR